MRAQASVFALAVAATLRAAAFAQAQACDPYGSYFLFLNDYPAEAQDPGWHENAQGLAHDDAYWYITQQSAVWKIPVGHDLTQNAESFLHRPVHYYPELDQYNHFGDPECWQAGGVWYLAIPVENTDHPERIPVVAFLDSNLNWVAAAPVSAPQNKAAWVAFDPAGFLYSSNGEGEGKLFRYSVSWDTLPQHSVTLPLESEILLRDEDGILVLSFGPFLQGGVFSECGDRFYLVVGNQDEHVANDGVNVFETTTWRRIRRSTQDSLPFRYEFHPASWPFVQQEPEGLTVWDFDAPGAPSAPNIGGQLHVIMLENEWSPNEDDIYIKHYSNTLCVDKSHSGAETGRPWEPFNTVGEAYNVYPIWDGGRIKIKAGSYPEALTFARRIQLLAWDGTVVIGAPGRTALHPEGATNRGGGGSLRLHGKSARRSEILPAGRSANQSGALRAHPTRR